MQITKETVGTLDYIINKFSPIMGKRSPINITKINRGIMADTLNELGFKVGVEVGILEGEHSEILCKHIPGLKLYCVDSWRAYGEYNGGIDGYTNANLEKFYKKALERLKPYNCEIIREFSMDAVKQFKDKSMDFVYIDGAHDFQTVVNDVCEWSKKVRPGGIFYGHDCKRVRNPTARHHVVDALCGYTYAYRIHPWFILGERGRSDGKYKEGTMSWMWVC